MAARVATSVVVTTIALALFGAGLAAVAILQAQLPPLDDGERVALLLRWSAVGGLAGLAVGLTVGLAVALVARAWIRRALLALLVATVAGTALVAGQRSDPAPGSALDAPREYTALSERSAAPGVPNLVLVTIDTLRRDHLELYGYERPTAPHLTALGRGGTVFEEAIVQAPETLHSMASLMVGLYPHVLDWEFEQRGRKGGFLGPGFHTLAERLAAAGYDTAGFVSNVYLTRKNGFGQGFRHFDDQSGMFWAGAAGRWKRAQHVVDPALAWLPQAVPPFFLWVHVIDPHHPYEPPTAGPWEDRSRVSVHSDVYERLTLDAYTERLKDLRADRRPPAAGEIPYLVGRYDAEILHVDHELARLRAGLQSRGFDDRNTVVVVTADHGEEFGDHGRMLHGHTLFDELIRVPLIMRGPGIPSGRRIAGQVQSLDVMATLLELAGAAGSGAASDDVDGVSLVPALARGETPARPALSFLLTRYVAYRTPELKVVSAFEPYELAPPSWMPWEGLVSMARVTIGRPHRPSIGLWRLTDDPHERRNLADADPATFRTAYTTLLDHRRAHPPRAVVSDAPPGLEAEHRRTLRALGYVE